MKFGETRGDSVDCRGSHFDNVWEAGRGADVNGWESEKMPDWNPFRFHGYLFIYFWDRFSYIPAWPQIFCVAEDNLELPDSSTSTSLVSRLQMWATLPGSCSVGVDFRQKLYQLSYTNSLVHGFNWRYLCKYSHEATEWGLLRSPRPVHFFHWLHLAPALSTFHCTLGTEVLTLRGEPRVWPRLPRENGAIFGDLISLSSVLCRVLSCPDGQLANNGVKTYYQLWKLGF